MSSRQLTKGQRAKGPSQLLLNFSITSKSLLNKDIIATIEDAVKDLEKKEADTIRVKVNFTLQNSKTPKDSQPKDEHKPLKEFQADTQL